MTTATRRRFLASSASAAAALAMGTRASARILGANESITLGFIGVGGMGSGLLDIFKKMEDVRVAAVCDVYEPHCDRAREAAGGKADREHDFRKVLDRKDIDAVVIATPDHWHAIPSIMAMQAGKDVYCEKPLAYRIAEGRAVADAASKYHRVTQMGNLIHAGENYHRVVEIVQSGVLGKITKARVWMARQSGSLGKPADSAPPPGLDYDFWLGPAPKRPYNANRSHFNWRWFWDYAGGLLMDFCCHIIDPVLWAMKVDSPETITATGGRYAIDDNCETPDTLEVAYHFAEGFDLVWSSTEANAHGIDNKGMGIEFQGTQGTLICDYNTFQVIPEGKEPIALPEKTLKRSAGHHREFLNAIKSRGECSCNFGYGHKLTTVGHLGNIALWTGEKLKWDGKAERITNHESANKHLSRNEYRAPWSLPKV
jgi:predicted dehydrogenase